MADVVNVDSDDSDDPLRNISSYLMTSYLNFSSPSSSSSSADFLSNFSLSVISNLSNQQSADSQTADFPSYYDQLISDSNSTLSINIPGNQNVTDGVPKSDADKLSEFMSVLRSQVLVEKIIYTILFILGSLGNLFVLYNLFQPRFKSKMNYLIRHLAVADLMVIFLTIGVELVWRFTIKWETNEFGCKIVQFWRIFPLYLTSLMMICISLDRFYAFVFPLTIFKSKERNFWFILTSYLVSFVASIPQAVIFHLESHPNIPGFTQCVTKGYFKDMKWLENLYNTGTLCLFYFIPLLFIIICYAMIIKNIDNGAHHRSNHSTKTLNNTSIGSNSHCSITRQTNIAKSLKNVRNVEMDENDTSIVSNSLRSDSVRTVQSKNAVHTKSSLKSNQQNISSSKNNEMKSIKNESGNTSSPAKEEIEKKKKDEEMKKEIAKKLMNPKMIDQKIQIEITYKKSKDAVEIPIDGGRLNMSQLQPIHRSTSSSSGSLLSDLSNYDIADIAKENGNQLIGKHSQQLIEKNLAPKSDSIEMEQIVSKCVSTEVVSNTIDTINHDEEGGGETEEDADERNGPNEKEEEKEDEIEKEEKEEKEILMKETINEKREENFSSKLIHLNVSRTTSADQSGSRKTEKDEDGDKENCEKMIVSQKSSFQSIRGGKKKDGDGETDKGRKGTRSGSSSAMNQHSLHSDKRTALMARAKKRTLRMSIAIVVTFMICWTPYSVMFMWELYDKNSSRTLIPLWLHDLLFIFAVTNSVVNPFIHSKHIFMDYIRRYRRNRTSLKSHSTAPQSVIETQV